MPAVGKPNPAEQPKVGKAVWEPLPSPASRLLYEPCPPPLAPPGGPLHLRYRPWYSGHGLDKTPTPKSLVTLGAWHRKQEFIKHESRSCPCGAVEINPTSIHEDAGYSIYIIRIHMAGKLPKVPSFPICYTNSYFSCRIQLISKKSKSKTNHFR